VTYEFEQEFWLKTDGSGSFEVTAPPWIWNVVKNVGQATNLDATVNDQALTALFNDRAILNPRVTRGSRNGRSNLTVTGDFSNVNALVGTKAFPDLAIGLRTEGERMRLFGVWRRPPFTGTAQGDESGTMAIRFHIPSEVFAHRNASLGLERGNVLSWTQDLKSGVAGAPIDFGATIGTTRVLSALFGAWGLPVLLGIAVVAFLLFLFSRRGRKRRRSRGSDSQSGRTEDSDFLNYDPGSGTK